MDENHKNLVKDPSGIHEKTGEDLKKTVLELYEKNNLKLRNFLVRHLNKKADIDDVVQEVFFRVIKYWKPDDREISLQMLCTIALNIIKNRYNRQKSHWVHPHVCLDDMELTSKTPSAEDILMYQKRMDTIRSVYKGLNKNSRRAFSLHRFKGYTYEEIADKMGISKSMVQKHISHTLFKLRKTLEGIK